MKEKTAVIGMGTGRCGTTSLVELLNYQGMCRILHEGNNAPRDVPPLKKVSPQYQKLNWLPWDVDIDNFKQWKHCFLNYMQECGDFEVYGDISFYNINYILLFRDFFAEIGMAAKFIYLYRQKEDVIRSYEQFWYGKHNLLSHSLHPCMQAYKGDHSWSRLYPKYYAGLNQALDLYWNDYHRKIHRYYIGHKEIDIYLVAMDDLNDESKMKSLFEFIGQVPAELKFKSVRLNQISECRTSMGDY
jgi:hypothetical protein